MDSPVVGRVPLVEVVRAGRVECVHYGCVAVCDADGNVLDALGHPELPTYLRSSAKPFQAATIVQLGAADRWNLTDAELALCCASHGAQPFHLEIVRSILAKCGFTPDDLLCGPHPPLHGPSAEALACSGQKPDRIHNNCSGKHAGMLAACRHKNWPAATYLEANHPLQQANLQTMAAFAGMDAAAIPLGVDGCGVPTFYLPLARIATAFARLANPDACPAPFDQCARRVVNAMARHPLHVAFDGELGAHLLQHLGEHVTGKGGAEGVFGVGLIGRGVGIACKISDGAHRALPALLVAMLERFARDLNLDPFRRDALKPVKNTRGEVVGELRAVMNA